jgi:hypothetical protein
MTEGRSHGEIERVSRNSMWHRHTGPRKSIDHGAMRVGALTAHSDWPFEGVVRPVGHSDAHFPPR